MAALRPVPLAAADRHVIPPRAPAGDGHGDGDGDDDFDDLPQTHLDDDAYDAFLKRELDADGNVRDTPPVTLILVVLIVIALAVAVVTLG